MKNVVSAGLAIVMGTLLLQGCAHGPDQRIDDKLSQEGAVKDRAQLRTETSEVIRTAPGLTDDQRSKLTDLSNTTRTQIDDISQQTLKLRALLVQEVVSSNYNADEVAGIKKRIRKLEAKRITAIFDAVDKANTILGRQAQTNQHIVREFLEPHGGRLD